MADEKKETPVKEEPKQLTPAELESQRKEFVDAFFSDKPKKKSVLDEKPEEPKKEEPKNEPEVKVEEPAKKDEPKEPEIKAEEPKPKKKKEPKQEVAEPEPASDYDIESITNQVTERLKPKEPEKKEETIPDGFDPAQRELLEAVNRLQASPKHKGKNLVKETQEFWNKENQYIAKWEIDHPEEEFDQTDKEHANFYNRNRPSYSDEELEQTLDAVKEDRLLARAREEVKKEFEPQMREVKAKEAFRTQEPEIAKAVNAAEYDFILKSMPDDYHELLKDAEGKKVINADTVKKLEEHDPVALEMLRASSEKFRTCVKEFEKLDRLREFVNPDLNMEVELSSGDVVMPLREVLRAGTKLETDISKLSKRDQMHEGKRFITRGELGQKQAEILNSNAPVESKSKALDTLNKQFWCIQKEDIIQKMASLEARNVRKVIEASKKRHGANGATNGKPAEKAVIEEVEKPKSRTVQTAAPAVASSSDNVDTQTQAKSKGNANSDEFVKAFFS